MGQEPRKNEVYSSLLSLLAKRKILLSQSRVELTTFRSSSRVAQLVDLSTSQEFSYSNAIPEQNILNRRLLFGGSPRPLVGAKIIACLGNIFGKVLSLCACSGSAILGRAGGPSERGSFHLCARTDLFSRHAVARAGGTGRTGAQKWSQKRVLNHGEGKNETPTSCVSFSPIL